MSTAGTAADAVDRRTDLRAPDAIANDPTIKPAKLLLSAASLGGAAVGLAAADYACHLAGDSVLPGGPLDEIAHLLTTLLVIGALWRRCSGRFLAGALAASVAIDVDHIPGRLGAGWLTSGTPRPYPHCLLTVAVALSAALLWRRHRELLLGVTIGLALHLWRDMSETGSGVALFWPFSYTSFRFSHTGYLAIMALVAAVAACRLQWGRR